MLDGHRLAVAHHEADEADAHHAAGLRHLADGFAGLGAQDISTVASTPGDVFVCTHAWWGADGPADDPLGSDAGALHASRALLLSFATVIVPGHGAAFRPDQHTAR